MEFKDPASYTDLSQGKIKHINFQIYVDFSRHIFDIEAIYQLQEPAHGSLFLDSFKIAYATAESIAAAFSPIDEGLLISQLPAGGK